MALVFIDSFDHYDTLLDKWDYADGSGNLPLTDVDPVIGSYGRNSTDGVLFDLNSSSFPTPANTFIGKNVPSVASGIVGFAAYYDPSSSAGTSSLVIFSDGSDDQVCLKVTAAGKFQFYRNQTQIGSDSTLSLPANQWSYVEVKVLIHDSTGTAEVRVNGTAYLALTGQDTKNSANATFNKIRVGCICHHYDNQPFILQIDDFYYCDTTGSTNNNFLGDIRVQALTPTGAGAYTEWTPSAGSNYQCVDENPPNGDTDYVSSATVGQRDTYALSNLTATTGSVKGVQVVSRVRKDDGGTRTIHNVVYASATLGESSDQSVSTSYTTVTTIHENNPSTSTAWTISGVNGMEAGVKVIA
jgi:hypothetical protein